MGLILDLAVAALGLLVVGSLAVLAWTFAISAVQATKYGRMRVAESRRSAVAAEARLRESGAALAAALEALAERVTPSKPGDEPDA